jgi:hypothetical protein
VTKVASGCPFCLTMLDEAVGAKGVQERIKPIDVLELVASRITRPQIAQTEAPSPGRADRGAVGGEVEHPGPTRGVPRSEGHNEMGEVRA